MNGRCVVAMGLVLAFVFVPAWAGPAPFHHGVKVGDGLLDVKVADALRHSDGRWLTFGSRVGSGGSGRETPLLVLREPDGTQSKAFELLLAGDLSYRPLSLVPVGTAGDVVVLGLEYTTPFAHRGLALTRLNAALEVVWSVRLETPAAVFEWARLKDRGASAPLLLIGELRRAGGLDRGDGLLALVHPEDGRVTDVRTLGVPADHERIVDVRPFGADGSMLLLVEVARQTGSGTTESGDGLVVLDPAGAIADARLLGHAIAPGILARALHLLPHADGGWVIAGRRIAVGPNVFYLHRVGADLAPDPVRMLVPFFNVIDADARDGAFWLYGEANGENFDTGTVLMRFNGALQMELQRRYATENHIFPTGALEFSPSGALLALGADRDGDAVFVYESVHHVDLPSGQGVLCEEGDYAGFSTVASAATVLLGWQPSIAALDLSAVAAAATVQPLAHTDVDVCVLPTRAWPRR